MSEAAYLNKDTIVAQATATGRGGVGIVRVSGPLAQVVALSILGKVPTPRQAIYSPFFDQEHQVIDQGIALFFNNPHSFTGEDVLELQGHGGQIIIELLIDACLKNKEVRLAKPGEFSEQAFLNGKLDLTQAEAIADLIDASSVQAAKGALRSLQGEFSTQINNLVEKVILLRMYVEAAIDFPDEEIDFLSDGKIKTDLQHIIDSFKDMQKIAKQGTLLRDGMSVVIVGRPNAGKSSLLNALAGKDSAIVTNIAGTTRDVLKEHIHIDGMPLHIIDTAGLRDSNDEVEKIGIARAWAEIEKADRILLMQDSTNDPHNLEIIIDSNFLAQLPKNAAISVIRNKCDESGEQIGITHQQHYPIIRISAKENLGIDELRNHLKVCMGYEQTNEGQVIARKRHIDALYQAFEHVLQGEFQLQENLAGELLAEELRLAQQDLNKITGEFSSDDLLGRIFSSFCIGK